MLLPTSVVLLIQKSLLLSLSDQKAESDQFCMQGMSELMQQTLMAMVYYWARQHYCGCSVSWLSVVPEYSICLSRSHRLSKLSKTTEKVDKSWKMFESTSNFFLHNVYRLAWCIIIFIEIRRTYYNLKYMYILYTASLLTSCAKCFKTQPSPWPTSLGASVRRRIFVHLFHVHFHLEVRMERFTTDVTLIDLDVT